MDTLIQSYFQKTNNPHLYILEQNKFVQFIVDIFKKKHELTQTKLKVLDIGGGSAWGDTLRNLNFIEYYILDIELNKDTDIIKYIKGDITDQSLFLPYTFDIIFSKDTFEHILNPWDSTSNILKYLNESGLLIIVVPFSWRYHPVPYDTFRYSHTGLRYMFERLNKLRPLISGYIPFQPTNGFWKNKKDSTLNESPFPSIETIYVGQKDDSYIFSKETLDSDFDYKHLT